MFYKSNARVYWARELVYPEIVDIGTRLTMIPTSVDEYRVHNFLDAFHFLFDIPSSFGVQYRFAHRSQIRPVFYKF